MLQELSATFQEVFGRPATVAGRAPGRVNLIGDHTDYNEGFVLPMAIDPQVITLARPSESNILRIYSRDYRQLASFDLSHIVPSQEARWSNYIGGVAQALQARGYPLVGADLAITGNVPWGAGLSSSAALEMAAGWTLAALAGVDMDRVELARCGQEAENHFVGVPTGIMDQFISALGQEDAALCIDCRDLTYQAVPLRLDRHGVAVVVVESGVQRGLVDSEYDTRRRECQEGTRLLQEMLPNRPIRSLRDVSEVDFARYGDRLPDVIRWRVRHVVTENARVLQRVEALQAGDLARFGQLMYESHVSLRDDYAVTVPAVDHLIALAHVTPGVLGTRITGGGFGGSTVHLVETAALSRFSQEVVGRYMADTGLIAPLYICRAVAGVGPLPLPTPTAPA